MAMSSYMQLYAKFSLIVDAIVTIMLEMISSGLSISETYMFGFSFGGQLASAVGRSLSPTHLFGYIDTCDMAGPGFDSVVVDHKKAAKHVQCFHSSRGKGTGSYSCHRNVLLGNCGYNQVAVVSQPHLGSHGLCHNIYINSFDYPFYALRETPTKCESISINSARNIPKGYTIGYDEHFNKEIIGKVFVPTSLNFPYNLSKRELLIRYKSFF